ncbi:MAG: ribonuclease E/G, partial [Paracoccaceae bacterium]
MAKKMLIDATHAEETRVVVADGNKVEEFDFESLNKRQLAGNIYLAKVTRVEPSLQAAFVDYGGNRHGFLAFSEIHPDYYQIPKADREALLAEERELAAEAEADEEEKSAPKRRRSRRRKSSDTRAEAAAGDAIATGEVSTPSGMDVIDLDADADSEVEADEALDATLTDTAALESDADIEVEADIEDGASDEDATAPAEAETIADDDDHEDIRPARKPRARKYKIQEVIKVRQIILVQVVKEERGNKGAALTTYLSLAGRYCVLMPNTARGGGISRKITNISDRKKLKEIAQSMEVPQGAGLIIRTAGSQRTKAEIKRDYEYLQRQWEQVRELTLRSIAPAPI